MNFNSIEYLGFLLAVIIMYYVLPYRFRWMALLAFSYFFYILFDLEMLLLMIGITVLSYGCVRFMDNSENSKVRKSWMICGIIVCLSPLIFFKYFNFFSSITTGGMRLLLPNVSDYALTLILPIGISFYTFKIISYIVDVYQQKIVAEKHIGYYALYVSFFPEIITGPIDRADNLIPQFKNNHDISYDNIVTGAQLIVWGLFKKVVIADSIATVVNTVYGNISQYNGFILLLVSFLYTLQLYCDFSACTDIARGSARMMGYNLAINFNSPYFSSSVREFWTRWHLSLSSWMRDYIYIPLGGNRVSRQRNYFNLFATFLVSGLWHGANWNFIIWGGIHGVFVVLEAIQQRFFKVASVPATGVRKALKIVVTFILINFAWIFFRLNLSDALYTIKHIFVPMDLQGKTIGTILAGIHIDLFFIIIVGSALLIVFIYDMVQYRTNTSTILIIQKLHFIPRWIIYYTIIIYIIVFGVYGPSFNPQSFIYYNF